MVDAVLDAMRYFLLLSTRSPYACTPSCVGVWSWSAAVFFFLFVPTFGLLSCCLGSQPTSCACSCAQFLEASELIYCVLLSFAPFSRLPEESRRSLRRNDGGRGGGGFYPRGVRHDHF